MTNLNDHFEQFFNDILELVKGHQYQPRKIQQHESYEQLESDHDYLNNNQSLLLGFLDHLDSLVTKQAIEKSCNPKTYSGTSAMIAIKDGQIVGVLAVEEYVAIDEPFPYGWDTLIQQIGNQFQVCDIDFMNNDMLNDMIRRHMP